MLDLGNESSLEPPTKVGIAQPQRRRNGPVYQVLGDNSVASQHKRFSLGIDRSTHPLKEPPSRQVIIYLENQNFNMMWFVWLPSAVSDTRYQGTDKGGS